MRDNDAEVGRVVAELRGERTQQSVADAMRRIGWRWSQATVWSVEKGERPLKLREAVGLAAILGTTVEILVGIDPDLVILSNRLTRIHAEIAAHRKQIGTLEQQLADAEAQLERAQQERRVLEKEFRNGVEASGAGNDLTLLAHLGSLGPAVQDLLGEKYDDRREAG